MDSSKDRTPEIAEQAGARVIRQFPPQGYGKTVELALRSASGDVVITLECDNISGFANGVSPAFAIF